MKKKKNISEHLAVGTFHVNIFATCPACSFLPNFVDRNTQRASFSLKTYLLLQISYNEVYDLEDRDDIKNE